VWLLQAPLLIPNTLSHATCAKGGVYLLYLRSCAFKYRNILYMEVLPALPALHAAFSSTANSLHSS
jgi:hypothetical protein